MFESLLSLRVKELELLINLSMREQWKDIRQMEVLNMVGVTRAEIVELNSINLINPELFTE